MIIIKATEHEQDWHRIREEVFVQEQGFQNEFDELDQQAIHIVLYEDEQPLGCGRIYQDIKSPALWHLGRLAILKQYRKGGYGRQLLHALEAQAKAHGAVSLVLSAQVQAIPFYEKCGYDAYGTVYMDEHVPHQAMKKLL